MCTSVVKILFSRVTSSIGLATADVHAVRDVPCLSFPTRQGSNIETMGCSKAVPYITDAERERKTLVNVHH